MDSSSVLSTIGTDIISVMSPVSICMLLVVFLVYSLSPASPNNNGTSLRTAATLVYLETPSDTATQKLEGALLNALVFVVLISAVTFMLVLLYYYNFTSFLKNYMRFSAFFVLASMGGSIFLSIIEHFSVPIDGFTCFVLIVNFTVVGVLSVFSPGIPIFVRQSYMVVLGIIVATWFTKLPEWTTWVLLVALAVYDLVAVLVPGGPLKMLVELASSRDEELPALIYEARPTISRNAERGGELGVFVGMGSGSVELQPVQHNDNVGENGGSSDQNFRARGSDNESEDEETSPLVANSVQRPVTSGGNSHHSQPDERLFGSVSSEIVEEETSPLVNGASSGSRAVERRRSRRDGGDHDSDIGMTMKAGIKLGLGDFVFYSVLVGRAAMYDLMTVYACYLAIISGLGCTLILLSVCQRALPALPISITLGVIFYFLTRLLMEPFVVGTSTNLLMF
ncbi:hypothetical protein Sjap_002007 [Stephania japonica]|uniref:Presenilin n=1 Tax=Stephania japonica TaxID=461633 RepID=A0AAP0KL01_9MAGN